MKEFSTIERVVGNVTDEGKKRISENMRERFENQVFPDLADREREKTPDERHILSLVDVATNDLRRLYGLSEFSIPEKNVHVIRDEQWPEKLDETRGFYLPRSQGSCIRETAGRIWFAAVSFHETLHMKSYGAMQVPVGRSSEYDDYRVGLTAQTRDGKRKYFTNLNEAVTEELTRIFIRTQLKHPFFAEEARRTREITERFPEAKSSEGGPLFTDATYFADIIREERHSEPGLLNRILGVESVTQYFMSAKFSYERERSILRTLLEKIVERNPDSFASPDDVFGMFVRAMLTGNIIPIGRLIDGTFGSGTFRKIGELDDDIDGQESYVQSL